MAELGGLSSVSLARWRIDAMIDFRYRLNEYFTHLIRIVFIISKAPLQSLETLTRVVYESHDPDWS